MEVKGKGSDGKQGDEVATKWERDGGRVREREKRCGEDRGRGREEEEWTGKQRREGEGR